MKLVLFIFFIIFSIESIANVDIVIIDDFGKDHSFIVRSLLDDKHSRVLELDAHDYINSLQKVIELKPAILNLSLGGTEEVPDEQKLLKQISDQGTIIVVASGNNNDELGSKNKMYPCVYKIKNLKCVGASENKFKKAKLSNYGYQVNYFISGKYKNMNMTSFAAPRLSKLILKIMKSRLDISVLDKISNPVIIAGKYTNFIEDKLLDNYLFFNKKVY